MFSHKWRVKIYTLWCSWQYKPSPQNSLSVGPRLYKISKQYRVGKKFMPPLKKKLAFLLSQFQVGPSQWVSKRLHVLITTPEMKAAAAVDA